GGTAGELAHPERIAVALLEEVVLPGNAALPDCARAVDDRSTGIGNADDEDQVRRQKPDIRQLGKLRMTGVTCMPVLHQVQSLIDLAQGAHDLRLVSVEKLAG